MCRSIKTLRRLESAPTDEELTAAALQFVRKISGYRTPAGANRDPFERTVAEVANASRRLFDELVFSTAPKPRAPRPR